MKKTDNVKYVTVKLAEDLHKKLKVFAAREGLTVQEAAVLAFERLLKGGSSGG